MADSGSSDNSLAWLAKNHPEVMTIRLDKNYGFSEGYNRAIKDAEYEYIVLLNSDVEVTPDWWKPMLSFMEKNPDAGAIQPKILSFAEKNRFEYAGAAGGYLDSLGYPYCRGRLFDCIEEDNGQYDGAPADICWASGACLWIYFYGFVSLYITFYNCAFVCSRLGRQYIVLRKDIIIFFHFAEIAVSVNYGFRVGKIEFCQKHQECQSVCKASEQQYLFPFFLRKILVEEKKVVAEIKVSLAWIPLGERCSANMIYG